MYEEIDYKRRLSVMVRRYCRRLDEGSLLSSDILPHIDLCCTDFPFSSAWFVQRPGFWAVDLDFETRCRQGHLNAALRVLVGWHNVEVFAARPLDRMYLYVNVDEFDWGSYKAHRLLGVPTSPVFSYYTNLAFSMISSYRHLARCVALMEFAVSAVMRFLCAARNGVPSLFGMDAAFDVGVPVLLPVSAAVLKLVEDINFLEIVRGSDFDAVPSLMAWKTMSALRWDSMIIGDTVPFVAFDPATSVASWDQGALPYAVSGALLLEDVSNFVQSYFESTNFEDGEIILPATEVPPIVELPPEPPHAQVVSIRMSGTVCSPLVAPLSSRVDVSVFSPAHGSLGQPSAAIMVFAANALTVAGSVRATDMIEASPSVPRRGSHGEIDLEDYRGSMEMLRDQREAATRLAALRLADLESARNDVAVAQLTITSRTTALDLVREENIRLVEEN